MYSHGVLPGCWDLQAINARAERSWSLLHCKVSCGCSVSGDKKLRRLSCAFMKVIELELQGEFIELNQLLKLAGLCASGGAGKMLVAQGRVTVDGNIELRKTCKIRAGQVVVFEDQRIDVIGTN